jgi:hypothetical protein
VQVAVKTQLHNDDHAVYIRRSNNLHAGKRGKEYFIFASRLWGGKQRKKRRWKRDVL